MKGIVFTEFLDMVEEKFSMDMVDTIINSSNLASNGVYTAVGTYDYSEIVQLSVNLSKESNIPLDQLLKIFGEHLLLEVFSKKFPDYFKSENDVFSFLEKVDSYIHQEVLKLYPDAELPKFSTHLIDDNELHMTYESNRSFADLADGLINGAIQYYKENITKERENLETPVGQKVLFKLVRH